MDSNAHQAFSFAISGGELQHRRCHHFTPDSSAKQQPPTVRGDGECLLQLSSCPSQQQQQDTHSDWHQHQDQHQDKWTCPCGGSCSDELTRLECRLSAMESRLTSFEALLRADLPLPPPPRSLSGDAGSFWPESTTDKQGGGGLAVDGGAGIGYGELSHGGASALNLVFSDDRSSSSAWTELGSGVPAATGAPQDEVQQQQQQLGQPKPQAPVAAQAAAAAAEDEASSSSGPDESFELVRYSTQETCVHQQEQQDSATCSTDCLDAASASFGCGGIGVGFGAGCVGSSQQRRQMMLRQANNSLLSVVLGRAEQLAAPRDKLDPLLTQAAPRQMAEPTACVGVSGGWAAVHPVCRQLPSSHPAVVRSALSHHHSSSGDAAPGAANAGTVVAPDASSSAAAAAPLLLDKRLTSSETATGGRSVDVVVRSSVSRVRRLRLGEGVGADCGGASWRGPPLTVCRDPVDHDDVDDCDKDEEDKEDEVDVTIDFGATASSVSSAGNTGTKAERLEGRRTPGSSTAAVACTAAASSGRSSSSSSSDCRLCSEIAPYARRRLSDLGRDGLLRRGGGGGGGASDVCIQRSGFSQLDTVLIAGLALKAASQFESEGDQAGYVRLALRKMGFECAVVIGRRFTGCICGMSSSRLLLDIGERSCLIFSFFELPSELSQASSAK